MVVVIGLALVATQNQAAGAGVSTKLCIGRGQVIFSTTKTGSCPRSEAKVTWTARTAKTVCIATTKTLQYSRTGKCLAKTTSASKKASNGVLQICTKLSSRQIRWRSSSICPKGFRKASMLVSREIKTAMAPTLFSPSPIQSGTSTSTSTTVSTTVSTTTTPTTTPTSSATTTTAPTTVTTIEATPESTTSSSVAPTTTATPSTPTSATTVAPMNTSTTTTTVVPTTTTTSTSTSTTTTSTTTTTAAPTTTTIAPTTTTTVPGPAAISSFTADDVTINRGSSTQLRASFSGLSGSINNAVGAISAGGSMTVSPTVTTTYVLTVSDADNTVTQSITVYVNSISIYGQPQSVIAASVAESYVSVGASGIGTLSYQWFKNDVSIPDANSRSYRVTTNGDYRAVVTSTYRGITMSVTSSVASYLINDAIITIQPTDSSILLGNTHSLSVDATGTGDLTYQWFLDNAEISGATSRIYVADTAGTYKVSVSSTLNGSTSTVISNNAVLTVTGLNITSISPNAYVTQGGSTPLAISVTISGGVSVTYQWQFNGTDISGAYGIGYLARQTGDYGVVATATRNGVTQVKTSSTTHVTAVAAPTITSFDSLAATITLGGSTDLVPVFANGTGVITPGDIAVVSGDQVSVSPTTTTTYTLTVTNLARSTVGMSYTVTVTTGTFTTTANASSLNRYHGSRSVTLTDGRVLVYGTDQDHGTVKTDVFDPPTNRFSAVGDSNFTRNDSPGVLLANGKVLVAGGTTYPNADFSSTSSAELFDPLTNTWSITGSMNIPRRSFFMVRLINGKVLVGGGIRDKSTSLKSAEIYDPATQTFSSVPDMPGSNRAGASAVLLSNGNVLVVGGSDGSSLWKSAIIFDTSTNSWSSVSSQMQTEHYLNAAIVTLNDGRVLIAGGQTLGAESVSKTDIFDPTTYTFSAGPELSTPRQGLTAHVLTNGKVVLIGGAAYESSTNSVDVYDPVTSRIIRQFNTMSYSRYGHSSALLLDGRVLIVGATDSAIGEIFTQ